MKSIYHIACLLLFLAASFMSIQAVNLDSLSERNRNKFLLAIAKEAVLHYGEEGYYREDPAPKIERFQRGEKGDRIIYEVTYLPKEEEVFVMGFAARVSFYNVTGLPFNVDYGNRLGKYVSDAYNMYLKNKYHGYKDPNRINHLNVVKQEEQEKVKFQSMDKKRFIEERMAPVIDISIEELERRLRGKVILGNRNDSIINQP